MDFMSILSQMAMLFLIVIVGYAANKLKLMDGDFNKKLTNLVLTVSNPCLILSSVLNSETVYSLGQIGSALGISLVGYGLSFVIALTVPKLLKVPEGTLGIYRFMLIFGNVGFMGFPVIKAIFGSEGTLYAAIINMPFNLLAYTIGALMVAGKGKDVKLDWRVLVTPNMIASVLSLVLTFVHIRVPDMICDVVDMLGQITSPAALLIVGSTLAEVPLRGIFGGPRLWVMAALRLLAGPVILWAIFHPLNPDPTALGVAIILQGMPVAAAGTMFALQYGGDTDTATRGTFLTTLLSVVTIPIIALLL